MQDHLKKSIWFSALAFALSWALVGVFLLVGGQWNTPVASLIAVVYMWMPLVAVIILQKGVYKQPVRTQTGLWFRLNRWWLVAWLLPVGIALATFGISLLLPGISFDPGMAGFYERLSDTMPAETIAQMKQQTRKLPVHVFWLTCIQALIFGPTINAVAAFGEEIGWRGHLMRLLMPAGFWRANLLIGLVWGIWHAPIILLGHNYPSHPVIGVLMMIIFCMLLSPLFGYIRIKARSMLAAAVMHGSLNATTGLSMMLVKGGGDLVTGTTGCAGFLALGLANLALWHSMGTGPQQPVLEQ